MKKTHILGLIVIALAIAALISIAGQAESYTDFQTAITQPDRNHQIVGYLSTDKEIVYKPEVDANTFSFYMKDKKNYEQKVICQQAKPQDFERSEEIVLTGKMKGDVFIAHHIQLKCPSKYQDEMIKTEGVEVVSNY